ncbi:ATP-binding cassette sub-family A member 3-like isoform X2 [Stegodyphus dumicola]|nr:ATP-binding cassette sub-family A member 3-like isoform X2 [Stegodyphus dumicola]
MMYGWASIPFSYLFTFRFKKSTSGFSILVMISVITGVIIATTLNALKILADSYHYEVFPLEVGLWILRIFPSFCISSGFSKLFAIAYNIGICYDVPKKDLDFLCSVKANSEDFANTCCKDSCKSNCFKQYLEWDYSTCAHDIMMLFLDGIIYFCCLLALEARTMEKWLSKHKKQQSGYGTPVEREVPLTRTEEDSDVISEEERVLSTHSNDSAHEALTVYNLSKMFKNLCAVDRLTFGIHEGECFGLLGVNGSGKTTTFRMLTGDCIPSEGNAVIKNFALMADLKKFQSCIGYCPQLDINTDYLTGREVLILFARLNGFDGKSMENRVDALIKMLNFNEADKQSQFYSGGSKRKLSIGIALIGSPPLIFLDEPTAGVDVVSKKKIWGIISQARIKTGSAVIIATHSMKECETLCDRLGIMVNGRFRCFGSVEQLKSKYGKGYTLTIKTKREAREDFQTMGRIKAFVICNLPGAQLKTEHQDMLQYHIVDPTISLSNLFRLMDEMKTQFDLKDCLISDTSLEQIFLSLARAQNHSA